MEIKPWEDNLNTGIPLIDIQHKTLFDLINYFYLMEEELDEEKTEFILKSIENYTLYHFATEEKFFEKCNYDKRESHIVKHQEFTSLLDEIKNLKIETKFHLIRGILFSFNIWMHKHISNEDMDYVDQLKNFLKSGT